MQRFLRLAAFLGVPVVLSLSASQAGAQAPISPRGVPGYTTPPVSPYLNLLRSGSPAAVNYYGIVRPEIQFQNALQNLQQQVTTLGTTTGAEANAALPPTGHPVSFMNYSHYFGASSPGRSSGRPGGVSTAAVSRPPSAAATPSPSRGAGGH